MNRKDMITDDLTNKWNKGELTTPKYIRALQEHAMELEEQNADLTQQVKEWKMALHIAEQRIKELEKECEYDQRNAAMSQRESGIHLDKIVELENKIKELEEPKRCDGCNMYGANFGNGYDRNYCTKLNMFTNNKFGCINYEPKAIE